MSIYIHASRASLGARALTRALRAAGSQAYRLKDGVMPAVKGDLIVNWGETLRVQAPEGVRVLNPKIIGNKLRELTRMELKGVPVPKFDLAGPRAGWIARAIHHTGGSDLSVVPRNPDYWVQKMDFEKEFRIHVFNGVSVRAGMKRHRDPAKLSAMSPTALATWVRSYDMGWTVYYDAPAKAAMRQAFREAAKAACAALEYDFGAVDIGVTREGAPYVLEVNSAPGLEGETLQTYVEKIGGLSVSTTV